MKGQKLFVRIVSPDDAPVIDAFLRSEDGTRFAPRDVAFLGKLIGDVVAFASAARRDRSLVLDTILVARRMQRKRVGRGMMKEIEQWARDEGFRSIEVAAGSGADSFFEKMGFSRVDGALIKRIE